MPKLQPYEAFYELREKLQAEVTEARDNMKKAVKRLNNSAYLHDAEVHFATYLYWEDIFEKAELKVASFIGMENLL